MPFSSLTLLFKVFFSDLLAGEPHRGGEGGAQARQGEGRPQSPQEAARQAVRHCGIELKLILSFNTEGGPYIAQVQPRDNCQSHPLIGLSVLKHSIVI